jgi:membrane-bound metal-dependent hydrolase YbcI (DUF457 family)
MVFSHAFAGAALIQLIVVPKVYKLSEKQLVLLYFVGISAAILPDLDIILLFIDKTLQHRTLLSHSIIPYMMVALIVWIISVLRNDRFLEKLALAAFVGVTSHFVLDVLVGGVVLLAPLNSKFIGFPLNFPTKPALWAQAYIASKYMLFEILIFLGYLAVMKGEKNNVLLGLPFFFLTVAVGMFLIVTFGIL